jgi:hypothetical protein
MKKNLTLTIVAIMLLTLTAGGCSNAVGSDNTGEENNMTNITLTIGSSVFSAKLYDNETARALLTLFPMTVNMTELNGNEKYYNLPHSLPTNHQQVGNINAGDLMIWSHHVLVVFYESLRTSYSYTRIGYVENVSGLASALGPGSVQVTFAVVE